MAEYYVTRHSSASDGNGGTNMTTDAWATIGHGIDNIAAGDTLWVSDWDQWSTSARIGFVLSAGDQGAAVLDVGVTTTGSFAAGKTTRIKGFKIATGDCDPGYTYYCSPYDAFMMALGGSPLNANAYQVEIDGDDLDNNIVKMNTKENVFWHYFYFHNSAPTAINRHMFWTYNSYGSGPIDCRFDDNNSNSDNQLVYLSNYESVLMNCCVGAANPGGVVNVIMWSDNMTCVGNVIGSAAGGYPLLTYGGVLDSNLFIGGEFVGLYSKYAYVNRNTFIDQTTAGLALYTGFVTAVGVVATNNIFSPAATADYGIYKQVANAGGLMVNRNNNFYSSTGGGVVTNHEYSVDAWDLWEGPQNREVNNNFADAGNGDYLAVGTYHYGMNSLGTVSGDPMGAFRKPPSMPAAFHVRDGVFYGINNATEGNLELPSGDDLRSGVSCGAGGTEVEGNLTLPSGDNLRTGFSCGTDGIEIAGNLTLPDDGIVIAGNSYGTNGTEIDGAYVVVAAGDVEESVTFGDESTETGTFVVPAEAEVEDGVEFGNSAEFTGTLVASVDPPTAPTITTSTSGTSVTVTIDGDAGATHYVRYRGAETAWQDGGSRSGDGDVTLTGLDYDTNYMILAYSLADTAVSTPSNAVLIRLTETSVNDIDTRLSTDSATFLTEYGEAVVYLPSGGGSRAITAIVDRNPAAGLDAGSHGLAPRLTICAANDSSTGISSSEVNTGGDLLTVAIRQGETAQNRPITRIVAHDPGMITLEVR